MQTNISVSKNGHKKCPVVAIGASAGGIEAMTQIIQNVPNNTGMAFVYIQHLDREHASTLVQIFERVTKIPVSEVQEGIALAPDHLFIIPPNTDMTIDDGVFKLTTRANYPVHHAPIDRFFLSLAEKKSEGAIAVLLSGTNSDGAAGIRAIKESGGITYVQDDSALFQTMTKSAFAEGFVDAVLSPHQIAQELVRLSHSALLLNLIPGDADDEEQYAQQFTAELKPEDVKKIIGVVRRTTGIDFTNYKQSTIHRRIIRRTLLQKLDNLGDYFTYLKKTPEEVNALYQDLLINVTRFFRDIESCTYLETELLPRLVKDRSAQNSLRFWVPACSTGEEAYSLAIMLCELMGEKALHNSVQIFATDLSEIVIAKARMGIYSKTDVNVVSPERLERFFTRVDGHYRINRALRMSAFLPRIIF